MTDSASSMRHTERPKKSFSLRSRSRSNSTEKEPHKKFSKKVASKSECGFLFSSLYTTAVNYLCHFRNTFAAFSFFKTNSVPCQMVPFQGKKPFIFYSGICPWLVLESCPPPLLLLCLPSRYFLAFQFRRHNGCHLKSNSHLHK